MRPILTFDPSLKLQTSLGEILWIAPLRRGLPISPIFQTAILKNVHVALITLFTAPSTARLLRFFCNRHFLQVTLDNYLPVELPLDLSPAVQAHLPFLGIGQGKKILDF